VSNLARGRPALIRVINPNSNVQVTQGMSDALDGLRLEGGPHIDCVTLCEGPFGVESLADVNLAERLLMEFISRDTEADAFVLGCYSDPGLFACRDLTHRPVFGIQECAALLAVSRGGKFGVLSLSNNSVERHLRHLAMLGLEGHCAGDRPVDLSVAESHGGSDTFEKLESVGRTLCEQDGARSIILGCTGMAAHRAPLEAALGCPVIEPTQAATSVALGAVCLTW
jgi:allantoin racemase